MAGKATFTLGLDPDWAISRELPSHYTWRIVRKPPNGHWPSAWFVYLLTGPDNQSDYTYIGKLGLKTGQVRLTKKSKMTSDGNMLGLLQRVLELIWKGNTSPIENAGFRLHHEGRCGRCGRVLTVPESIRSGIGPECKTKVETF